MRCLKNFFLITWQLPQMLIGAVLLKVLEVKSLEYIKEKNIFIFIVESNWFSGISLGGFIFINEKIDNKTVRKHEFGHTICSWLLGPFYLIVIGIPSLTWNIIHSTLRLKPQLYYKFYTEKLADILGGVNENERLF